MKYIFGLGNPGAQYELTRHNVGFLFLDYLLEEYDHKTDQSNPNYESFDLSINNHKFKLIYPLRFMNLSGQIVSSFVEKLELNTDDFMVIYDDFHLPFGKIRLRPKGSAAGHNGIKNITDLLGTEEYLRLRIGIDEPKGDIIDYVLGEFKDNDLIDLPLIFDHAKNALLMWANESFKKAMDNFNGLNVLEKD